MNTKDEALRVERALKLALEALEVINSSDNDRDFLHSYECEALWVAIDTIREALAEQPAQQEPVARSSAYDMIDRFLQNNLNSDEDYAEYSKALDSLYTSPPAQQQEPVASEHITDGRPCWCEPETNYKDPETGISVIVHKEPQ